MWDRRNIADLLRRRLSLKPALGACAFGLLVFFAWPEEKVDFNRDIRPIFNTRCIACHGGVKAAGGFSVLFREEALRKGDSGRPGIVPGDADASELMRRITHHDPKERMPRDADPLSKEEIGLLRRWIDQGAEWADHWAYLKPEPQPLPEVSDPAWPAVGLDHFILARLDREGLTPSPAADCAALIRRASLDLTGLPPAPEDVTSFCADPTPDAYGKAVDRLLALERFGEHWAVMWLDLARYADTKGYEKDAHRGIWRYRDWVIDAFNRDLTFDRFTIEQIAGDLLPGATDEQILATAFHRNTMTNDEGGTDNEEFRTAAVIDRVNTTWEVWQSTTMSCVQCHSHPYDPFRQTEYYQSLAFFNNTADRDWTDEMPRLPAYAEADQAKVEEILAWLKANGAGPEKTVTNSTWEQVEKTLFPEGRNAVSSYDGFDDVYSESEWTSPNADGSWVRYDSLNLTGVQDLSIIYSSRTPGGSVEVRVGAPDGPQIAYLPIQDREGGPPQEMIRVPVTPTQGVHDLYFVMRRGTQGGYRLISYTLHRSRRSEPPELRQAILEKRIALASIPIEYDTPALMELPSSQRRKTHVFERGNWLAKAQEVRPGVPGSLPPLPEGVKTDRLALAKWMVSPENPLTARVAVNRFWAQIFGTGIVETLEDFGTMGMPPSHPELLDHLALRFMNEHGWSVKKLLREIVTSSTYRQSSRVTPDLLEKDPANRLLARAPRIRLSAEQVRDQALAVSGLLSAKMHGPSVMPPQPGGLWIVPYNNEKWINAQGEDRYRRAVYTYWKRTVPYPSMVAFDSPTRDFCVSRRIRTNTPLQALVTLNDPVYVEASQAFARRVAPLGKTPEARIKAAYRLALGRDPAPQTLTRLKQLYDQSTAFYKANPAKLALAVNPYTPYDTVSTYAEGKRIPAPAPKLAPVFDTPPSDSQDVAALTIVAGAILNLDAFLTKD